MSEDYSDSPSSQHDRSNCEQQPYTDESLPYIESPSPSFYEQQPTPSVQQPRPPTEEDKLAATYQLGNIIARYRSEPADFTIDDIPAGPHGLVVVIFFATLVIWLFTRTPPWLLILFCLLVPAPWLSRVVSRLPADMIVALQNMEFYLCTKGLMITRWTRVQVLRWEQIQAVQYCRTQNILDAYYILHLTEGKPVTLRRSLVGNGLMDLGNAIEHETSQYLLPDAIAAYEAGQVLSFGPIKVTPQGLTLENEQQCLPWNRFATVEYYNGYFLAIKERPADKKGTIVSTWQKIEVASMLNLCVFLPLITHIENNLHTRRPKSEDATSHKTAEEMAAQEREANRRFQEQHSAEEEELERMRRMHEEILEHLRVRREVTPIPEEVVEALRILDLPSDASFDAIRHRFRLLAKRYHPDTGGDPETFKRINAAYQRVITWITSQDKGNS